MPRKPTPDPLPSLFETPAPAQPGRPSRAPAAGATSPRNTRAGATPPPGKVADGTAERRPDSAPGARVAREAATRDHAAFGRDSESPWGRYLRGRAGARAETERLANATNEQNALFVTERGGSALHAPKETTPFKAFDATVRQFLGRHEMSATGAPPENVLRLFCLEHGMRYTPIQEEGRTRTLLTAECNGLLFAARGTNLLDALHAVRFYVARGPEEAVGRAAPKPTKESEMARRTREKSPREQAFDYVPHRVAQRDALVKMGRLDAFVANEHDLRHAAAVGIEKPEQYSAQELLVRIQTLTQDIFEARGEGVYTKDRLAGEDAEDTTRHVGSIEQRQNNRWNDNARPTFTPSSPTPKKGGR